MGLWQRQANKAWQGRCGPSIKDWFYTDNKPTTLDLTKMLNNEKNLKLRKNKAP